MTIRIKLLGDHTSHPPYGQRQWEPVSRFSRGWRASWVSSASTTTAAWGPLTLIPAKSGGACRFNGGAAVSFCQQVH
jgi:hypothetical protein